MSVTGMYTDILKKRTTLAKKIIAEHFEMTLSNDRNINYLWFMYYKGTKRDMFRPFIFIFELNLLNSLNIITQDEIQSIGKMIESEDQDNQYIAIMAIDNFRKQRIKVHGQYKKGSMDVSDDFREVVSKYSTHAIKNYSLDKL